MVARSDASGFPPERPTYPWIGVSTTGTIVLFTAEDTGTVVGHSVVATPGTRHLSPFGQHDTQWATSCFVPYAGKVTLYNE